MKLSFDEVGYRVKEAVLLSDVNLDVHEGSRIAIIGPNGAGKSTFIRLAAGDFSPTTGSIVYGHTSVQDITVADRARLRAVLSHERTTDIPFTVHQVILMGRYPYRFDRDRDVEMDRETVDEAIETLDLVELRDRPVHSLSGGEQQRVAIARVLAQQAPIVLLDEPTTALDIGHQESVMALIESLGAQGRTVLAVLHDLNLTLHFDRVVVLANGKVVTSGKPSEVLTSGVLTSVYGHPIDVVEHPTRPGNLMLPRRADPTI